MGNEWEGKGWEAALLEFHIRSEGIQRMNRVMMRNKQETCRAGVNEIKIQVNQGMKSEGITKHECISS